MSHVVQAWLTSATLAVHRATSASAQRSRFTASFDGGGFDGLSFDVLAFDDGAGDRLFVGGSFRVAGAVGALNVAAWDGTRCSAVGSGTSAAVRSLAAFYDGTGPALYMAAGLRFRNGQVESYDALGVWPGAMLAFEDELGRSKALWFAGRFESAGGIPSRGAARWSEPCAAWTSYCTAKTNR
jgi:hypothetical protein